MSTEKERKMWHDGFYGGIQIELKEYRDVLEYSIEQTLGKEPLIVDMIIIKKEKDVVIENEIGRIFRGHNIVEFKSPDDGLTIDDLCKTVGYAMFYKSLSETVNGIPLEEMTVSLVRDTYPRGLFEELKRQHADVEEKYSGVYYVRGIVCIPVQIVVTGKLKSLEHSWVKVLSNRAEEEDVLRILSDAQGFAEQGERLNASAVLNVSAAANDELYTRIRSVTGMNENAFFDIFFKEKVEKMVAEGEARGEARGEAIGEAKGEARGEVKGRMEGKAEGRAEGRESILAALRQLGVSEELLEQAANSV